MEFKGAEATVTINGEVVKKRERKSYRHPELDEKLRRERTATEARIMEEARKHGASVPEVHEIEDYTLTMEKAEGKPLKHVIEPGHLEGYGKNVAYMHSADIIHGDLTTSNAVLGDELSVIDFGLSFRSHRIEDKAVDIHLLKQVLESSHPEIADKAWEKFVEGYSEYEDSEKVLEQLEEVESRGRYK
ncbi:MAG: KEOPS complex kinase/ATPase Bud32 [Candidatus Nanohaloarchaea archaeon]